MTKDYKWDQLHKMAGSTTRPSSSGMSIRGARDAGVTKDYTPAHIQRLADSIKPVDAPAQPAPKKSPLIKKYNIEGDTATTTPELFRTMFTDKSSAIAKLKDLGVRKINITSFDVDMVFEFFDEMAVPKTSKDTAYTQTRDIMVHGVVQAAGMDKQIVIQHMNGVVGYLTVERTNEVIAKVGANRDKSSFYTTEWGKMGEISGAAIFKDSETVRSAVFHYQSKGGVNLNHAFRNSANKFELLNIGHLFHPDQAERHGVDTKNMRKIQIQHVAGSILSTTATTPEQLMSDVFRDATNGYALYAATNFNVPPVAILVPPKKDLG